MPLTHHSQQRAETLEVERFDEVVERPELDGFDCRIDGGVTGHQDDGAFGLEGANGPEHFQPVELRHLKVHENNVRTQVRDARNRRGASAVADDVEFQTPGKPLHEREYSRFVVDGRQSGQAADHEVVPSPASSSSAYNSTARGAVPRMAPSRGVPRQALIGGRDLDAAVEGPP
jgi:hypothetical protein